MITQTILLVEDNPEDELLTLRALKKQNIANPIVIAHDGVEALDYLLGRGAYADRDKSEKPLLVILDLKLPRLDGHEVLQQIRNNKDLQDIPVTILSSSNEVRDISDSYTHGANSYICKPVDYEQYMSVVGMIGTYWTMFNQTTLT